MAIKPINGHLLIEPVKHESFIASQNDVFEEVGIVIDNGDQLFLNESTPTNGSKVFFDSWLAAKYPKPDGDGFFWLVKFEDVRAMDDGK